MMYLDDGKQYRSEWLRTACAKIGVKLIFAKPYSPESKGKVEAFNKRVDFFLSEAALSGKKTNVNRLSDFCILTQGKSAFICKFRMSNEGRSNSMEGANSMKMRVIFLKDYRPRYLELNASLLNLLTLL
jgi:transposase InsO family protein